MARPTKYTPERVKKICDAIERGETLERAAQLGGITYKTVNEWMNTKSEFGDAVKRAQQAYEDWEYKQLLSDAKKSLKSLILGIEYEETKTTYEPDPRNPANPRIKSQVVTTKRIPPNATALIFALCNRDPEHWQQKVTNEVTGKVTTDSEPVISLKKVPTELLEQLADALNED